MERINKPLTRDFLQSVGVTFDGAYWVAPNTPIRLQASDRENTWMVTIPDLPLGHPQPEPISTYTEYLRLLMSFVPAFINARKSMHQVTNQQQEIEAVAHSLLEFFQFDKKLAFNLQVGPMGAGLQPGNEYTHTLLTGNETRFKVLYQEQDPDNHFEVDVYTSPECVCTQFLKKLLVTEYGVDPEAVDILSVLIETDDNKWESFFGAGLGIPNKTKAQ